MKTLPISPEPRLPAQREPSTKLTVAQFHQLADVPPAIGDHQARALLDAPDPSTLQGLRDRAILATLLYHGLRRAELCALKVSDLQPPARDHAFTRPWQGRQGALCAAAPWYSRTD